MRSWRACGKLGPALGAVAALAAGCSDGTPIGPASVAPAAPSYAVQGAAQRRAARRHVVVLKRGSGSAGLRAAVQARGGRVEWADSDIGVVTASGLSDAAVAELAARADVDGIGLDVVVQWLPPGARFNRATIERPSAPPSAQTDQRAALAFGIQWNMRRISADAAWLVTNQGAGALVCILDTGIDPDHRDLAGRVDLATSRSFVATEPTISDFNAHGTFVAGLVASNGIVMASVAPDARLCAVKVLDRTGEGSFADVIAGMMYAARAGADVLNLSLGSYFSRKEPGAKQLVRALQRAVDFATRRGALVVAAAGNDGINLDRDPRSFIHVPSQLDNVLSVGATAPFSQMNFDALASYTNFGRTGVDVMAPGGDLLPGGLLIDLVLSACSHFQTELPFECTTEDYIFGAGTSFATPHAAGTAAVAESERRRNQDGETLSECVTRGADDLGAPGRDPLYGRGRINVVGAAAQCRPHYSS